MPNQIDHRSYSLKLNGVQITGLADEDPPVQLPVIDLNDPTFGKDGLMYPQGTSMQGGDVIVKLAPTSPSTARLLNWVTSIMNGERLRFYGEFGEAGSGTKTWTEMEGGVLKSSPPGIMPGQTAEFTFTFEKLIPHFENADFDPVPYASTDGQPADV